MGEGLAPVPNGMTDIYAPTHFQKRRLQVYEAGCLCLIITVLVFVSVLFFIGSSNRWTPMPDLRHQETSFQAGRVILAGDGDWLVWADATSTVLGTCDLGHPGKMRFLCPPPNTGIRPVEVLDGDLITLITVPRSSIWQIIKRGWGSLTGKESHTEQDSASTPGSVTVHLQRVNLITGKVTTSVPGGTYDLGDTGTSVDPHSRGADLTDLESGNVSLSPDHLSLAWWSAREVVAKSPLSATVTERLEILASGPKFKKLLEKEIKTDGTLSVRSRLLEQTGQPMWMSNDRCLIFSTLDSGSLIPFDCGEGNIEATIPLPALQQTLAEGAPVNNYDPEGFQILSGKDGHDSEILVWTHLPGSIHLFVLDPLFHLIRHTQIDDKGLDLSQVLWLKRSQILLVRDDSTSHLVGITPQGEREGVFPVPPDWGESFQILGENRDGDLIGYNRGMFLSAKSGDEAWETLEIFQ